MVPQTLRTLADSCGAFLTENTGNLEITSICTDTRRLKPGCLFVALQGERFDGHAYVKEAIEKGAAAVLVERSVQTGDRPRLQVANTRTALGEIAAKYRARFDLPICAVAGSNGKTTTKELIASVLAQQFATVKSPASFNNDIGVPLTLMQIEPFHEVGVLEVGTNHPGELARLLPMISPKYGVMTNIGSEHLEFFGSLERVAEEEGCLADFIPPEGTLFLNGDDPWSEKIVKRCRGKIVRVGFANKTDWRAGEIHLDAEGATFSVEAPMDSHCGEYRVNLLGRHQVSNALFAIAVSAELGVEASRIRKGLAACEPGNLRMEKSVIKGAVLLNDCYNANLDSMKASLQTLAEYPCSGERIAVLGDMAELGERATQAHVDAGFAAGSCRLDLLIAVGELARGYLEGAARAGFDRCRHFPTTEEAAGFLSDFLQSGNVILLKASRAMSLENISNQLRNTST